MGVAGLASFRAGCRRAALLCVPVLALLVPASAAEAQRLLTLLPGVGQAASAGDLGPSIGPVPTAVQVDLELLRSAPARLEVPTPDGSVLSAERSVFENRGGGDLMWSGGQPEAGYDTVVLTVEGGRLVGRFGAAGGGVYQIHAERDGRGGMAPIVGLQPDGPVPFCGVEAGAVHFHDGVAHVASDTLPADPPKRVSDPQSYDRLDILVAYTATAAENWVDRGGAEAAIRHVGDYLKMVFRNNDLPVEPHIVHIAQASATLDRVGRDLGRQEWALGFSFPNLLRQVVVDGELERLRHEHGADLVHLFTGERPSLLWACGSANLLRKGRTALRPSGWTSNLCPNYAGTFAHEIGHSLGAHHDPANVRRPEQLFRPYAYGHANFDVMPSLGTAMSYRGQVEPFFSTPRLQPWGAVLGIANERDNERLLQETVHLAVRYSDYLESLEGLPAQPSDFRVEYSNGAARLFWRDNAPDADGYRAIYTWYYEGAVAGNDGQDLEGRTQATIPLDFTEPGARYDFHLSARKGSRLSLPSSVAALVIPGPPIAAPSDVSATVAINGNLVDVRWTDNSDNEDGFEVQLLVDGEPIRRTSVLRDGESTVFTAYNTQPRAGGDYGVRVFAYNSSGYSESSEVASFRWEHPSGPGAVADVAAAAIGPTTVRVTWTPEPGVEIYTVRASLRGWHHTRRWYPPGDGSPSARVDFEDLPRGGRYEFSVRPFGGLGSSAFLTLGERGPGGPEAPSDLSREEGEVGSIVLSWKDNSSDELGFEIQSAPIGTESWSRLVTVPANTESVAYRRLHGHVFRVFAYNERGFSASSPRVHEPAPEPPPPPAGSCQADAETLCLQDSRFQVKVNWWNADGESGMGRVVEDRTDDSGLFRFFGPENWEILVKVLDGCQTNGRFWVLGASTTNLGYRIQVTDTLTGDSRSYENEPGQAAPAIVDTEAFSAACVDGAAP